VVKEKTGGKVMKQLIFLATLFFAATVQGGDLVDKNTGVSFPDQVKVGEATLKATGVATRKKFFVKIYSIASYAQENSGLTASNAFTKILEPGFAKQLSQKWVRTVDAGKIKEGFKEVFQKTLGDQYKSQESQINQFLSYLGDVKSGDEFVFQWLKDNSVHVLVNGQEKGKVDSEVFAKGLWGGWFGKVSVVNRNELISRLQ
jgi:hypothetical protein